MNDELLQYVTAGRATFTLSVAYSHETQRYTYKVQQDQSNPRRFFVKVLYGPDNLEDYRYIGLFYDDTLVLRTTRASIVKQVDERIKVFNTLLDEICDRANLDRCVLDIYKSKRCARCGRLLTTPDSIQLGLGPECRNHA